MPGARARRPNVFVAGDGAGIGGAKAAAAARASLRRSRVAEKLGAPTSAQPTCNRLRRCGVALGRELALRPFLDAL